MRCYECNDFGQILREKRHELGLTLRKCAKQYGLDPGNLSKMEHGILKPYNYFDDDE